MSSREVTTGQVSLEARNIGGIERTRVGFEQGITILTGRNATNRTSLLQAIMAGLGSERVSLKGDAEKGDVTLEIGDEEYTRTLERTADGVRFSGDPYLDDPALADLFAFLLQSNEARRTVQLQGDLRDIIMRPVDSDAIRAEIRQLEARRDSIDDEIDAYESERSRLPKLEKRRQSLEAKIEEKRDQLEEKREQLERRSTSTEQARDGQSKLSEKMDILQTKQSDLESTEFRLSSERESLASLHSERDELCEEYEDLTEGVTGELDEVESEIDRLREAKRRIQSDLNQLQNVIQFNEGMLEGTNREIASALRDDESNEAVTDQLVESDGSIVCWTCGSEVEEADIERTLVRLRDVRQSKFGEQQEIEDELSELTERRSRMESVREKHESIENRLAEVRKEIDDRDTAIEDLETEQERLAAEVTRLEVEIEELETKDRSEVLDIHHEVNDLELEASRLEDEHEDLLEETETIQEQVDAIEDLEERRESISDQLQELRTRIDRIEEQAIQEFNEHMSTVLDILDYNNLERVWVERAERAGGHRGDPKTEFRLHVIRATEEGVTYEDAFAHLSESEREVTGLVFALAGYLAHDVYEKVPFILLDSLEAIDAGRIAKLIEYVGDFAEHLVVALLEEDAGALDDAYERITDI